MYLSEYPKNNEKRPASFQSEIAEKTGLSQKSVIFSTACRV